MSTPNRLIAALDVPEFDVTVQLATILKPHVGMVKIGLESFVAHGPKIVQAVRDVGVEVFLDLKLHDIPRTAAAAAAMASRHGVKLLTIHAAGGADMVAAVRDAATPETNIIAVTVLTSLDGAAAGAMGLGSDVSQLAYSLGRSAMRHGADGLVCSGHELPVLADLGGSRVVPGVRPAGAQGHDQKRVTTPAQAVQTGATWIVVGRPITLAHDPAAAAASISHELARTQAPVAP